MKTFEFNSEIITIEKAGYGQYTLRGLETSAHCTESRIWDWCDDEEDEESLEKSKEAKSRAYRILEEMRNSDTSMHESYSVRLLEEHQASIELERFNGLHEAKSYFDTLNVDELEDNQEYELQKRDGDDELADWSNEELNSINWPENSWVIKSK